MRVAVVGQGYVGLPLAISAAKAGHDVSGIDLNSDLVTSVSSGRSPIGDVTNIDLQEVLFHQFSRSSNYLRADALRCKLRARPLFLESGSRGNLRKLG